MAAVGEALRPGRSTASVALVAALALCLGALASAEPVTALLAGIVLLGAYAVAAHPRTGLFLVVAALPLDTSLGTVASSVGPSKLGGGAAFLGFLANVLVRRRRLSGDAGYILLGALSAVYVVSAALSATPSASAVGVERIVSFVGVYLLLTQLGDAELLPPLLLVLATSTATASAFALGSFASTLIAKPTGGDPNDFAFLLVTVLPMALWLASRERGVRRLVAVVSCAVIGITVPLTLSRGGLVGLGIGVVWHLLTERRHRLLLVSLVAAIATLVAVGIGAAPGTFAEALGRKQNIASYNVSSRLQAWDVDLRLASAHPILGVGPENFGNYFRPLTDTPAQAFGLAVSHNTYLDLAAEVGLTGLGLFLAFLALAAMRLNSVIRTRRGPPGLAAVLRTCLVIAACAAPFSSQQYGAPFWLLTGFAAVAVRD
jgi:putative inorganic carbon (HCO3(-)) transporter